MNKYSILRSLIKLRIITVINGIIKISKKKVRNLHLWILLIFLHITGILQFLNLNSKHNNKHKHKNQSNKSIKQSTKVTKNEIN